MSDFRLQKGINVTYDKDMYQFEFEGIDFFKHKKVTSRAFSCLIGENQWESIGKTLLERFRAIEKEDIDIYYMVRGDMAELLVIEYLKNHFDKKHIPIDLRTWDKEKIGYDNFPNNDRFGGMIDIAIANPQEQRAVIEVKSKSEKDIPYIKKNRGNIDEVLQGQFMTKLSPNVDKCLMVYVFFTQNQEEYIKEYIGTQQQIGYPIESRYLAKEIIKTMKWSFGSCKIMVFKYDISDEITNKDLETKMKVAYNNMLHFRDNHTISEAFFSREEIKYLKELAKKNGSEVPEEIDEPF
jgi:hypothetical protein